ncbi:MAG: hypothetical protein LUC87_05740 [Clostridiales bacterium]|nr:hypothetical protein [Clostridiales bacterium]
MKRKILALLLALATACSLTACGGGAESSVTDGETSSASTSAEAESSSADTSAEAESASGSSLTSEEEAILAAVPAEAREDCVAYLTDGVLSNDTVVITLDGVDITADMFIYFLSYYETYYMLMFSSSGYDVSLEDSYSDDMTYADFFVQIAEDASIQMAVARSLAEEAEVTFTEENQTSLEEAMAEQTESDLLYVGANAGAMEDVLTCTIYGNAYQLAVYGEGGSEEITDEMAEEYAEENGYYNCRYILFMGVDLEGEELEAVQAEAQACYEALSQLSGDELVEEFQAQQAALNENGDTEECYVSPSSDLSFGDTVLALEEYEVGITDATDYGYFVVLRLPLGDENLSSVKQDYADELFSAAINDAISAADITYADVLEEMDYTAFFDALAALQETIDSAS